MRSDENVQENREQENRAGKKKVYWGKKAVIKWKVRYLL